MFSWPWTVAIVVVLIAAVIAFFILRNKGIIRFRRKRKELPAAKE